MANQVWAFSFVRDEGEIIEPVIRQLFSEGIDGMVVVDDGSVDTTRQILGRLSGEYNLQAIVDAQESFYYYQGKRATKVANICHDLGADWIIPFDADECFYGVGTTIADYLRVLRHEVVSVRMKNYFATGFDNVNDLNPITRERWRKYHYNPLNKVVFQWRPGIEVANGNHHVSVNGQQLVEHPEVYIEIGHFQNRSAKHFIRKIRREAANQVEDESARTNTGHWWRFGKLSDEEITSMWMRDYYFPNPKETGLVYDPVPVKVMA